jgi:hypothetical protein
VKGENRIQWQPLDAVGRQYHVDARYSFRASWSAYLLSFLVLARAKADLARACFSFFAVCVCRWRYAQLSFASPSLGQIKQMYQNRHRILF